MNKKLTGILCSTALGCLIVGMPMSANAQRVVFPQTKQAGTATLDASANKYVLGNNLLHVSYSVKNGMLRFDGCPEMDLLPSDVLFRVRLADCTEFTSSDMKLENVTTETYAADTQAAKGSERFAGKGVKAVFTRGGMRIEWRAVLRDGSHYLRTEMSIMSDKDVAMDHIKPMVYAVDNRKAKTAPVVVGNTRGAVLLSNKIFAGLETPMGVNTNNVDAADIATINNRDIIPMEGNWVRHTTLKAGKTWNVSSVVGLVAEGQPRRSFLAYSERERAAAWHPMTIYNSWYELNIDRNNAPGNRGKYDAEDKQNLKGDYSENMTATQCEDVVAHWKKNFYDVYGKAPVAFVFDDGWDAYGTWTFNPNFPEGFKNVDRMAREMGVGIGAWLGPVGGYGASGEYRRGYWRGRGGMQLSNPAYYDYFVKCSSDMIDKYDFRFFKYDGISAQFSAVGPDMTDAGIENCEAIISIENDVRKKRKDIFYNTTVGTWASPFWFHVSDAVWRQEGDFGKIGVGDDREQWITYRDRLVHQNFVDRSPICPINTLMTHGVILTRFGDVSKTMDYDGIVREMRCAFGCGSSMVELYTDYKLLDEIKNSKGTLWKQLADGMDWQQRNADVLPDIHWVGGNPWDGKKANIYGWAAWNGKKTTLTLRNPDVAAQTLTTTLREVFDIPAYIKTSVTLRSSFADQRIGKGGISGLPVGKAVDIDKQITISMPKSSVFVFEGVDKGNFDFGEANK
ncbi:hypothetical protein [uncultured Prevotella sp.]|uniref:hypothetical protein n=1 Tax=uncultured Prevotella sp. TaxID=159272 RepID=UPI00260C8EFF|nr:hypothetical protein [uncultured Prevotella sp.]